MSFREHYLLCPADRYAVEYVINPWMDGNVGRADNAEARRQWRRFHDELAKRADVSTCVPGEGLPDKVFSANAGIVMDGVFAPSRFRYPQRQGEVAEYSAWMAAAGIRVAAAPEAGHEGEGDVLLHPGTRRMWAGYGVRTTLESHRELAVFFGVEVVSLRLIDERFYHLDTCFCPLPGGRAFYFPAAFDRPSLEAIRSRVAPEYRIEIGEEDALGFACNAVPAGGSILLNHAGDGLRAKLAAWGYETVICPVGQFMLAGGATKCLCLRLRHDAPAGPAPGSSEAAGAAVSGVTDTAMVLRGHLLDHGMLTTAMDVIVDAGGGFNVERFEAGQRRDQDSVATVRVFAPTPDRLGPMVHRLEALGATPA